MPDIHVCGVFRAGIDTPIIEHGCELHWPCCGAAPFPVRS
jgi:hypothetical protein